MSFPAYEEYKTSGVEWLGDVPRSWNVRPIKGFSSLFGRIGFRGYTTADIVNEGEGAITLSPSNMVEAGMNFDKCTFISWDKYHESPEIKVRPHDLLMVKTGSTLGKVSYVPECEHDMTVNPQIVVFKNIKCNPRFFFYVLSTPYIQSSVFVKNAGSSIPTITQQSIGAFRTPLPPPLEQTAIASFLDAETSKIDGLVSEQRRLIELLKEKRQAVISHAVTKGLNPDVKMKDSGIQWLGEVPEHWHLHKLKHVAEIVGGGTPSREKLEYWNGDIPWVSPKDMKSETISSAEECITELGLDNSTTNLQKAGRVLMVIRSGILQHTLPVAINAVPVALNQDMKSFSFNESKCLPEFFLRWIQGLNDVLLLAWANEGATVENINQTLLQNTVLPLPDVDEQRTIASFLKSETSKFDTLVAKAESAIELLQERRTALISAAVTGKIDVRRYAQTKQEAITSAGNRASFRS